MDVLLCFIRGEWRKRAGFPSGPKPTLIPALSTSGDLLGVFMAVVTLVYMTTMKTMSRSRSASAVESTWGLCVYAFYEKWLMNTGVKGTGLLEFGPWQHRHFFS